MEESVDNNKVVMRPPRMVQISHEVYSEKYWPYICSAVQQILQNPEHIIFSQEELYRGIYNVCCQRHGPLLFRDLSQVVASHLSALLTRIAPLPDNAVLMVVLDSWTTFKRAVLIIHETFRHLEKVYLLEKMSTSLDKEFCSYYRTIIISPLQFRLSIILPQLSSPTSNPDFCMSVVRQLYDIDKDLSRLNPHLFSLYIPVLVPSRGPEAGLKETNEFFSQVQNQGLSDSVNLKRKVLTST